MPDIVNLDELVPDDIVFAYRGEEYLVPGDLDTETVFKMFSHLRALMDLRPENPEERISDENVRIAADNLSALLLGVFQIRQPGMETLPFGVRSTSIITTKLLSLIGVGPEGGAEDTPTPAPANRSQRRSKPPSTKPKKASPPSRRSSGSRSS